MAEASFPTAFTTISTENGLTNNRINTIFKDAKGFIWLGTQVGINRFDGNTIKQYNQIGSEEVFCIDETDDENLWIGTESGLKKYNRRNNTVETINLYSSKLAVRDLHVIGKNRFLVASGHGLFVVEGDDIQHIVFDNGLSDSNILTSITNSGPNEFWFASQSGICRFNLSTKQTAVYKASNQDINYNNFTSIQAVDSILYIGTYNRGVVRFDIKKKEFSPVIELQDSYILNVSHFDGKLYIGTNGYGLKIYSLKTKSLTTIQHEVKNLYSINSNAIYSFLLDGETFWIGTYKGGLNYNPNINNYFQIFQSGRFNSSDYNVRSFYLGNNGDKLIGTRSGLIYLSPQKNIFKRFTIDDSSILSSDIILYISPLNENEFLIGTYGGGMYRFNTRNVQLSRFINLDVFLNGCIFRFIKDKSGIWWIATDRGLFEYNTDNKNIRSYTTTNSGLINNNILYLYEDTKERIWLGTSEGLCILDKSSRTIKRNVVVDQSDALKNIICMLEDSEGNIWIGSHQQFAKINSSLSSILPVTFNQENIGVMSIVEDRKKNIWLGTNQGVISYNILTSKYKTFNMRDGIISYDFANVVQMTSENDIWWANEKGLIHCFLPDLETTRGSIKPVITNIIFTKETKSSLIETSPEFTTQINLPSDANDIRFEFSHLNFAPPQANVYEYILEGYDKGWRSQVGINEATYNRLPPGKYLFKVRDITDNSIYTSVNVTIRKDFSKALWIFLIVLTSLLTLFLLYKNKSLAAKKLWGRFDDKKYEQSKVQDSRAKQIIKQLDRYMETEKPYLKHGLKQVDVAKKINVSTVELSQVLNQYLGINFSDYINKFRIDELVIKMQDKSSSKYTLTALAEQCGFNSRSSFFRAIKKHSGQTPAEFLKKTGKNPNI